MGVQIVGRYRDELGLLRLAHAFEQATQFWRQTPSFAADA
ncbi:amidase [Bordetella trematum]|nr:amidase [Bordetella trematum]